MPSLRDRRVPLGNVFNFRDLGGYHTADGRAVREGRLFRADGLNRLDHADVAQLRGFGLRAIVDLRTAEERDQWGVAPAEHLGAEIVHLPLISRLWPRDELHDGHDPVAYLVDRYREMTEEGAPVLRRVLELAAGHPRAMPLVFHCSAGKDRTGVTAAVLLALLGVPDDQIAEDYAMTAAAMGDLVAWIRRNAPGEVDPMADQPTTWLSCPPEAMVGFLRILQEEHGSPEGYAERIGITADLLAKFRGAMLVA